MNRLQSGRFRSSAWLAWGLVLLGPALGGCASTIADLPLVGVPASAPARAAQSGQYLPVHDLPPPRNDVVLDPSQQQQLEKDLLAARDRQATSAQTAQRKAN